MKPTLPEPFTADLLTLWERARWIRPIDRALAEFLHAHEPCHAAVFLACILVSYQLGRGHTALDLHAVHTDPNTTLDWHMPSDRVLKDALKHAFTPQTLLSNFTETEWIEYLRNSPLTSSPTDSNITPLVLEDKLLYLKKYFDKECRVAQHVHRLMNLRSPDPKNLKHYLDELFTSPPQNAPDWQALAAALCVRSGLTLITGGPGTGKTTTVVRVLALLQRLHTDTPNAPPLIIELATPTGKAAARLTESISKELTKLPTEHRAHIPTRVKTLHRLLGTIPHQQSFQHHATNPLALDVLVIDEVSMISLDIMAAVLDALPSHARLILLGDRHQLASVEAGAVLSSLSPPSLPFAHAQELCMSPENIAWLNRLSAVQLTAAAERPDRRHDHQIMLRISHRFTDDSEIGQLARAVNQNHDPQHEHPAMTLLNTAYSRKDSALCWVDTQHSLKRIIRNGYKTYLTRVTQPPNDPHEQDDWARDCLKAYAQFQVLTALRDGDDGLHRLNQNIQTWLGNQLTDTHKTWFAGRPVMMNRNDYSLELMNGDIGLTLLWRDPEQHYPDGLRVAFQREDGSIRWVLPTRLDQIDTVFAMTVHKSQGSEFEHVVLVLPERDTPILTRELIYTGLTRARQKFTLFAKNIEIFKNALNRHIIRSGGLEKRLKQLNPPQK